MFLLVRELAQNEEKNASSGQSWLVDGFHDNY